MTLSRIVSVAFPCALLASAACADNQMQIDSPGTGTSAKAAATAAAPPPPAATESATPLSTVLTTDPAMLQQMFAGAAAASPAALAPGGGAGDPIEDGIKTTAYKMSPGMQADGPIAKGTLVEKGHSEMMVTLQVGKCYSIVGYSPPGGVGDLDLHLLSPPLYNILSGEDTTDDNMPVIAKAPSPICPTVAVPLPYKVDIFADRGAGAFGVQLFSKTK
jgi:hypothetical protein